MTEMFRPSDLHRIADEQETLEMQELLEKKRKTGNQEREMHDAFMNFDKVRPEAMDLVVCAVRHATEQGLTEVKVMQFPPDSCTDGGRAINSFDEDWPATLQGRAKAVMEFYRAKLQPLAYNARAEIFSCSGGVPGDVGLFLIW